MTSNKQILYFYDKMKLEGFTCHYALHEDVGYNKDKQFNCAEIPFNMLHCLERNDNQIVVMADTHDYPKLEEVIDKVIAMKFKYLIHAGDYGHAENMDIIMRFNGKVYGVLGNHDRQYVAQYLQYLKRYEGRLFMGYDRLQVTLSLNQWFDILHENDDLLDYNFPYTGRSQLPCHVIFGHTHKPVLFQKDWLRILNPGILCNQGDKIPTFCIYDMRNPERSVFVKV